MDKKISPKKVISLVSQLAASDGEAVVQRRVEYPFVTITPGSLRP